MNRLTERRSRLHIPIDDISESDIQKDLNDVRYTDPIDRAPEPVYDPDLDPKDISVEMGGGRNRGRYRDSFNAFQGGGRAVNKFRNKKFDPSLDARNFGDPDEDLLADAIRDAGILNPQRNMNDIRGRNYERRFHPRQDLDEQGLKPSLSDTGLARREKLGRYPIPEPLETDEALFDRPKLDNDLSPEKEDFKDWGSVQTKLKQQRGKGHFFPQRQHDSGRRHGRKDKESLHDIISYLKKQTEEEEGKVKSHANVRHSSTPETGHKGHNKTEPSEKVTKTARVSMTSTTAVANHLYSTTSKPTRKRPKIKKPADKKKSLMARKRVLTTWASTSTEKSVNDDTIDQEIEAIFAEDSKQSTMSFGLENLLRDEIKKQPIKPAAEVDDGKSNKTRLASNSHGNKTFHEIIDSGADVVDLRMSLTESSWKNLLHGRRDIVLSGSIIAGVGILLIIFSIFQMLLFKRRTKSPVNQNNNKKYRRLGSYDERMNLKGPQHSLFPLSSDDESDEETVYQYMKYRDGHH